MVNSLSFSAHNLYQLRTISIVSSLSILALITIHQHRLEFNRMCDKFEWVSDDYEMRREFKS